MEIIVPENLEASCREPLHFLMCADPLFQTGSQTVPERFFTDPTKATLMFRVISFCVMQRKA